MTGRPQDKVCCILDITLCKESSLKVSAVYIKYYFQIYQHVPIAVPRAENVADV